MLAYAWVEGLEAYCFTALVGVDPEEAIRRLGGDPSTVEGRRTFDECFWPADGPQWAQVGPVDDGVLVAEHNGWRAEEFVEKLSKGARLACFYRNVQAVTHFVYAEDGVVLAEFDPLVNSAAVSGSRPLVLQSAMLDLPFGLFAAEPSAMSLVERMTGVRISEAWLRQPQRATLLPPLPSIMTWRS